MDFALAAVVMARSPGATTVLECYPDSILICTRKARRITDDRSVPSPL